MKIISWNVNGIRAAVKKGYTDFFSKESPDILCLQEVKARPEQVEKPVSNPEGYFSLWNTGTRPGYSGVATFSKIKPLSHEFSFGDSSFDSEGRTIMAEFDKFILFNIYFPNGQKDDERLKYKMDFYASFLKHCIKLKTKKSIIVSGDVNTAHKEIDLTHPKANENTSGFLPIERKWIDDFIASGFTDSFRHFNKKPEQYSWWSYRMNSREHNVGWRLDYHFVTNDLVPHLKKAYILSDVSGSDHCPVALEIF